MALQISFWIIAIVGVVSALSVIILKDVFRAALALVLCFISVAGIYITLSADFLAIAQILIYVGAISVLIILAIMMTREVKMGNLDNRLKVPAFFIAAIFLAILLFSMFTTPWHLSNDPVPGVTANNLARQLFGENGFALPVEIAAMLLLASILGAITMVREK
ncbi:MAG: nuoJ [Chloroflexi bacterium]|jgi:NADH-quinone oxidoreductase subunit J|nr:nuoJ [Chloroflexota bacterium]